MSPARRRGRIRLGGNITFRPLCSGQLLSHLKPRGAEEACGQAVLLSSCLLQRGRGCGAARLGKDDRVPERAELLSVVPQHRCSHQGNATRAILERASPFWGVGAGMGPWGRSAASPAAPAPSQARRRICFVYSATLALAGVC